MRQPPQDHANGDGDVEGVFCTLLGDFKGKIAGINYGLLHSFHLIAKDKGVLGAGLTAEGIQFYGIHSLLHGNDGVAIGLKAADQVHGIIHVLRWHNFLCAKGYLAEFGRRRHGAYPAKIDYIHAKCIRGTEGAPHIVGAPDIVQHQRNAAGGPYRAVLLGRYPAQFPV